MRKIQKSILYENAQKIRNSTNFFVITKSVSENNKYYETNSVLSKTRIMEVMIRGICEILYWLLYVILG